MGNYKDDTIRIVRGKDRYAGAPNTNLELKLEFEQSNRSKIDGERNIIVNLEDRFNLERELSQKYRLVGKITNIFENKISGSTTYDGFKNDLFYNDSLSSISTGVWKGYPQYKEFSFLRNEGIPDHVKFNKKDIGNYNWMLYVTYVSENNESQQMSYTYFDEDTQYTHDYVVSEGIPYHIKKIKYNGKNLILFYCAYKHNLNIGDWVKLNTPIQVSENRYKEYFEVYRLGDLAYGNEDKVFGIYDYGYSENSFTSFSSGTIKRVKDINNIEETTSSYYVRVHKTLTEQNNVDITNMGFENTNFPSKEQIERATLTPNGVERVSKKNGTQTVGFSFDKDVDLNGLLDNHGRPITELFITIINRGYMGYFNKPYNNKTIRIGWEFNFLNEGLDDWWNFTNPYNIDDIPHGNYEKNSKVFYYNEYLSEGHQLKGDICEFNNFDQEEVVLSKMYHKYSFNPTHFNTNDSVTQPAGYSYITHHLVPIKVYSDYVETGDVDKVDLVPDYAYYSEYENQWRWRDIYLHGFIDSDGNGLDIPFFNGCHYPYSSFLFLQTPMIRNNNTSLDVIVQPTSDECE